MLKGRLYEAKRSCVDFGLFENNLQIDCNGGVSSTLLYIFYLQFRFFSLYINVRMPTTSVRDKAYPKSRCGRHSVYIIKIFYLFSNRTTFSTCGV